MIGGEGGGRVGDESSWIGGDLLGVEWCGGVVAASAGAVVVGAGAGVGRGRGSVGSTFGSVP